MTGDVTKDGDRVAVRYTGKLEDGTVFDSNVDGEPLWFTIGGSEVIPGFEKAATGLSVGEKTEAEIAPGDGYGERDEELVIPVRAEVFGETVPEPGMEVALRGQDGTVFNGRVERTEQETVHVDLNHPLAGKTLHFDIEVAEIGAEMPAE